MTIKNIIPPENNKGVLENATWLRITKRTVKFGTSIYQLKNVTGFKVGEIPKQQFSLMHFLILLIGGILLLSFGVGFIMIILAIFMLFRHLNQEQLYGLSLYLNSGEERYFISNNKLFLDDIVNTLYNFLEDSQQESIQIDLSNRTINVGRDFHGIANTGDRSNFE